MVRIAKGSKRIPNDSAFFRKRISNDRDFYSERKMEFVIIRCTLALNELLTVYVLPLLLPYFGLVFQIPFKQYFQFIYIQ